MPAYNPVERMPPTPMQQFRKARKCSAACLEELPDISPKESIRMGERLLRNGLPWCPTNIHMQAVRDAMSARQEKQGRAALIKEVWNLYIEEQLCLPMN